MHFPVRAQMFQLLVVALVISTALLQGPLPLTILEKQVNAWIASQKAVNVGAGALTRSAEHSSAVVQSPN